MNHITKDTKFAHENKGCAGLQFIYLVLIITVDF